MRKFKIGDIVHARTDYEDNYVAIGEWWSTLPDPHECLEVVGIEGDDEDDYFTYIDVKVLSTGKVELGFYSERFELVEYDFDPVGLLDLL